MESLNDNLVPELSDSLVVGLLSIDDEINLTRSNAQKDDYRLTNFTIGDLVTIDLASLEFDTYLQLVDANTQEVIAENDYGDDYNNSKLRFVALEGISYIVRVTSYSAGEIGEYTLAATTSLPPDLAIVNATAPLNANVSETIEVSWTVTNQGGASILGGGYGSEVFYDAIYLSDDAILDETDTQIAFQGSGSQLPLAPGDSYTFNDAITLPNNGAGSRYLLFVTDTNQDQNEVSEDNNVYALPIEISAPDLVVSAAVTPTSAIIGETIEVSWTVSNQGNLEISGGGYGYEGWYDAVYVSDDSTFDDTDTLISIRRAGERLPLAPTASYTLTENIIIPNVGTGNRYLLFVSDKYNEQGETDESNNILSVPIELKAPDLVVSTAITSVTAILGQTVTVDWTVTNIGEVAAVTDWYDIIYISDDTTLDWTDTFVANKWTGALTPLAAGSSYSTSLNLTIPNTGTGNRYLLFASDGYNFQGETNETNNVFSVPIELKAPDLVVTAATTPITAALGQTVTVGWTVTNIGEVAAVTDWYDRVYISNDTTLDWTDTFIANKWTGALTPLAAGSSYSTSLNLTIPNTGTGNRYLLFVSDFDNNQGETNESNNVFSVPIELKAPDLVVTAATTPITAALGQTVAVGWTVTNIGEVAAMTDWYDRIYISNDTTLDWTDTFVADEWTGALTPLAAGSSYSTSLNLTIPNTGTGNRYLLFVSDIYNIQGETNESNNVFSVPVEIKAADLVITSTNAPTSVILNDTAVISWTVTNIGNGTTSTDWYDSVYISSDTTLDYWDTLLTYQLIGNQTPLAGGDSYTINSNITIPITELGDRYLLFVTDRYPSSYYYYGYTYQIESNENNNILVVPIEFKAPDADVVVSATTAPTTAAIGQTVELSWSVTNLGNVAAPADWYDSVYISDDATFDYTDTLLINYWTGNQTPLVAGGSYTATQDVSLPVTAMGNRYLLFVTDRLNSQGETNESNNVSSLPITITAADLQVNLGVLPDSAVLGDSINVSWSVSNSGNGVAATGWLDRLYFSRDNTISGDDILLWTETTSNTSPLLAGATYTKSATVALPLDATLSSDTYYILVKTDADSEQLEVQQNNNTSTASLFLTLPPLPDLVISNIVAPVEGLSGQQIEISWTVTNQGTGDASGPWTDRVYLSNDSIAGADRLFGEFSFTGTIAAGESIVRKQLITLPVDFTGNHWAIVQTDVHNQLFEHANENNNTTVDEPSIDIRLSPFPNLQVSNVTAPLTAFSRQKTLVEWTVTNTGTGSTSAPVWYDAVWLSLDNTFDSSDIFLGQVTNASYLNPNESYTNSLLVTLPETIDGNYYFLVKTDYSQQVYEYKSEGDNFGAGSVTEIELTAPPDLQPTAIIAPSQAFSGQTMTVGWTVTNNGPAQTSDYSWYDEIYMSADNILDGSDLYLTRFYHSGDLDVGASYSASTNVNLPIGVSGDFYFVVKTDAGNQVREVAYEANNSAPQATPTTVRLTPPPDLEVELVATPTEATASHALTINYRVTNYGATVTPNYAWADAFYLSADSQFDPSADLLLGNVNHYGYLEAGEFYNASATLTLPNGLSGSYYTFVVTDNNNTVFELDNSNNFGSSVSPLIVSSRPADLVVSAVNVPVSIEAGKTTFVNWTVTNTGTGDTAVTAWNDKLYASTDAVLDDKDILLGQFNHFGLLNAGDSYSFNQQIAIPFNLAGSYYLFVATDTENKVYEAAVEDNNSTSLLTTVTRQTPDLQVTQASAPTTALSGNSFTTNWTVQNFGTGRTNSYFWYDSVYLSADAALNVQQDIYLGQVFHSGALDPLTQYSASATFDLPVDLVGDFYIIVRTDDTDRKNQREWVLEDPLEDNNDRATPSATNITLGSVPNLVVASVDAPVAGISGQFFDVNWTIRNDGVDTEYASWYDAIYLSPDQIFDRSTDTYLDYRYHAGGLMAGQEYTQTQSFKIPQGFSGPFYVFVVTDGGNQIYERGAEANNVGYDGNSIQVSLPLPADLTVGSITIPANAIPGQNTTISYTINNQGPNAAAGSWYDSIYISADEQWDINDAYFGRVQHTGYVSSGSSYSETASAPLPGVVPGDYHVIIRSDIRNAIGESNENNNIGGSLTQVAIDAQQLQLGGTATGILFQGQSVYYKIVVPEGETVQITFDSASNDGFNELYVRYGEMPTQANFDFGFEQISADQQILVPLTQAGTYYVLARTVNASDWVSNVPMEDGTTMSGFAASYTLQAETVDFGISSLGQTVGDVGGKITIQISGAKFSPYMTAVLDNGAGHTVVASDIWFEDSTEVFATFDLTTVPTGTYDLKVSQLVDTFNYQGTGIGSVETEVVTVVMEDGFSIVDSRPDDVLISVESTRAVSPGQSFDIIVTYTNRGSHDVVAPLIVVNADPDIRLENIQDGDELAQFGSMTLLGISNEGPAGGASHLCNEY